MDCLLRMIREIRGADADTCTSTYTPGLLVLGMNPSSDTCRLVLKVPEKRTHHFKEHDQFPTVNTKSFHSSHHDCSSLKKGKQQLQEA